MDKLVQYGYLPDLAYMKNKAGKLISVDNNSFDVPLQNMDFFTSNGTNKLTSEMVEGINMFSNVEGVENVNLFVNSMHRGADHDLTKQYPNSRHVMGDAVDFSVRNGSQIDHDLIDFYYKAHQQVKNNGYDLILEADDELYKTMVAKYGTEFVKKMYDHSTGVHVHMEYNRPKLTEEDLYQ